jgi:hypothetical protein
MNICSIDNEHVAENLTDGTAKAQVLSAYFKN